MIKRITLFMALFIGCIALMNAQTVIFEEDWSGVSLGSDGLGDVPSDWSVYDEDNNTPQITWMTDAWVIGDVGLSTPMALSSSWFTTMEPADRWLVSPQITLTEGNILRFNDVAPDPGYPDTYEVLVSTTGNSPSDFTDDPVFTVTPSGDVTERNVSLSDYEGEDVYIAFRNVETDGYLVGIGNIEVLEIVGTDLEPSSINTPSVVSNEEIEIEATFKNNGGETITSFEATWSIDDEEYSQTVSGISLESLDTYDLTFDESWDATAGSYTLEVSVSNINGEGDDDNTSNDSLSKDIVVASGSTQKTLLYEEFTSSMCGPCASWNEQAFDPFFNELDQDGYGDDYSLIRYQYWIPDADPYFTNEGLDRGELYGVNADPTMFYEGQEADYGNVEYLNEIPTVLREQFEEDLNKPAFFELDVQADFSNENIDVSVSTLPYISGDYTLQVAIVEKHTTGNVGVNGETDFYQVMMKMLPDADGTAISFTDGEEDSQTFSIDLTEESITSGYSVIPGSGPANGQPMAPHIEEYDDLEVIAWIQNNETKEIMQSKTSEVVLGVNDYSDEISKLSIYPNPSKGFLNVNTQVPVDVTISNILGQQVFEQMNVDNTTSLDISDLPSGVYMVTLSQKEESVTKKLIVK